MFKKLFVFLIMLLASGLTAAEDTSAFTQVFPAAPAGLFLKGEKLLFTTQKAEAVFVRDIYGKTVWQGNSSNGKIILPDLPQGAYFLSFAAGDALSFAVLPEVKPSTGAASVIAMDAGLDATSYVLAKGKWAINDKLMAEVARRCGIGTLRGRTGWRESTKNTYIYQPQISAAKKLKERNIELAGMADMPGGSWTKTGCTGLTPRGENQRKRQQGLPDDLFSVYNYFKAFASASAGLYQYMEYQNEPDLDGYPPWEVAAQNKAAYLGMKAGNPALQVLSPSFCQIDTVYMKHFFHDSASKYFDVFNFHVYYHIAAVPGVCSTYKKSLKDAGLSGMPQFITEFGSGYEDFLKPGKLSPIRKKIITPSMEQELLAAEAISKLYLKYITLGIDKAFLFYLPPYSERKGLKEWGQLRFNTTARPSLIAAANLTNALSGKEYIKDLPLPAGVNAKLFCDARGNETVIFWRTSVVDLKNKAKSYSIADTVKVPIPCPRGEYIYRDMYGFEQKVENTTGTLTLPLSSRIGYLFSRNRFGVSLNARKKAPVFKQDASAASKQVLRLITQKGAVVDSGRKFARVEQNNVKLLFEVYNFDTGSATGKITCDQDDVILNGLPEEITLPPLSKKSFELDLQFAENASVRTTLKLSGEFNGKPTAPASVRFLLANRPESWEEVPLEGASDPLRWRRNASGKLTITAKDDALEFATDYTGTTSRWSYPEYILSPEESMKNAIGFAVDIKLADAKKTANKFRYYLVPSTIHESGDSQSAVFYAKESNEWTRVYVFWAYSEKFISSVRQIRLGNAARNQKESYQLRNFSLIFPRQD